MNNKIVRAQEKKTEYLLDANCLVLMSKVF